MNKKITLILIIILIAVAGFIYLIYPRQGNDNQSSQLDVFAQCLAGKGATMYGAYWCSHCQNEKKAFGNSFQFVPYVECTQEPKKCLAAGIEGYPTWIFGDGRRFEGEQGLQRLSIESGCPL